MLRSCQPPQDLSLFPSWAENKTHSSTGLQTHERFTDRVQK